MRTSIAESNDFRCPICGDKLTQDKAGRGFMRHKNDANCKHGNKERDSDKIEANNTNSTSGSSA